MVVKFVDKCGGPWWCWISRGGHGMSSATHGGLTEPLPVNLSHTYNSSRSYPYSHPFPSTPTPTESLNCNPYPPLAQQPVHLPHYPTIHPSSSPSYPPSFFDTFYPPIPLQHFLAHTLTIPFVHPPATTTNMHSTIDGFLVEMMKTQITALFQGLGDEETGRWEGRNTILCGVFSWGIGRWGDGLFSSFISCSCFLLFSDVYFTACIDPLHFVLFFCPTHGSVSDCLHRALSSLSLSSCPYDN
jgi:hypothetical protein